MFNIPNHVNIYIKYGFDIDGECCSTCKRNALFFCRKHADLLILDGIDITH